MLTESGKSILIINVKNVTSITELHKLLKSELSFPDFYGMNWDAFWDAITGLVELPNSIIFEDWSHLEDLFPEDTKIVKNLFIKMNGMYPNLRCEVEYKSNSLIIRTCREFCPGI